MVTPMIRLDSPTQPAGAGPEPVVQLMGTTTTCAEEMYRLCRLLGIEDGGTAVVSGVLQRELDNAQVPGAAAVMRDGRPIGYLPTWVQNAGAENFGFRVYLAEDTSHVVPVQIFAAILDQGFRAEAWVWLADGDPIWKWSESNPPPLSPEAKRIARQADVSLQLRKRLDDPQVIAGMTESGFHYLELVEPLHQLKREGRNNEALIMVVAGLRAVLAAHGPEFPPFFLQQAGIVLRKLQRGNEALLLDAEFAQYKAGELSMHQLVDRLNSLS